ncbi:50S ribosomal protein L3 N(5)-glutamine methyltransferase [Blochmannia endosymbiont of Colobopsis nipponica]|uniref:50S ribosomal protein L3 N(5)-glutamine methyltransferase n=1 Tax=Blochmannia endosymbiont of Colobopsis nipponica TaxID=2681987 RepID=UPI001780EB22|nr:50S ribosomal protein L3 N(5)-glutamine methyltransferase [Blochmannia endosymbiont of Colobopsis nipponica]QOI10967.1 50S ribosomal protein L3 N(5)-glutamine methyltransferase [Blochmannia endosymbiont of Colobopsis nipponica]
MANHIKKNKYNISYETENLSTILDMVRWSISKFNASEIFYGHGTNNAWDEAINLIFSILNLPNNLPLEIYNARLTINERKKITKLIKKRIIKRVPVPYLTNQAWFCKLKFFVDERVLIPRSPIGEIIDNNFYNLLPNTPLYVLDMCTGSGCIAIAIATVYPKVKVDAVDISLEALQVAEYNIKLHNMDKRVLPIQSNLFKNIIPIIKYDLIISNPPYVSKNEMNKLPKEFQAEPSLSLIGGDDGLKLIHDILVNSPKYLKEKGILICEVGNNKKKIKKLYPQIPFYWITLNKGGDGVFMLTRKELNNYNLIFKKKLKNYTK